MGSVTVMRMDLGLKCLLADHVHYLPATRKPLHRHGSQLGDGSHSAEMWLAEGRSDKRLRTSSLFRNQQVISKINVLLVQA